MCFKWWTPDFLCLSLSRSPDYDGVGDSFRLSLFKSSLVQDADTTFEGWPECSSWPSRTWGAPRGNVPLLNELDRAAPLSTLNENALTPGKSYLTTLTSASRIFLFAFRNGGLYCTTWGILICCFSWPLIVFSSPIVFAETPKSRLTYLSSLG